jgi:hypothetical protein
MGNGDHRIYVEEGQSRANASHSIVLMTSQSLGQFYARGPLEFRSFLGN